MRLDLYGQTNAEATAQISSTGLSKTPVTKHSVAQKGAPIEDKTTLSSGTDSVQTLTKAALSPNAARAAKVALLKQAISSQQYQLDSDKIAAAIVSTEI